MGAASGLQSARPSPSAACLAIACLTTGCASNTPVTGGGPLFTGERRAVHACLQERLRTDPDDVEALVAMAQIHLEEGYAADALALADDALRSDLDHVGALIIKSVAGRRSGRLSPSEVLSWADRAARIDPDNPLARFHLAEAHVGVDRTEEALTGFAFVLTRSVEADLRVSSHLARAEIFERQGDTAAAKQEIDSARSLIPDLEGWSHRARLREETAAAVLATESGRRRGTTHPETSRRLERLMAQIDHPGTDEPCLP